MADLGNTAVISPTDASNGSGTHPSWLGSAAPSTIDDAGRALQGAVAREWNNRSYVTSSGTAPNFVVAYTVAPAALRSGQTYTFTAHAAAVGSDDVNINTLGAKAINKVVAGVKTALAANDFYIGDKIAVVYDGTDMVWTNWQGAGFSASTTTQQLTGTSAAVASTPDSVAALWEAGADITDGAAITIGEGAYFNLITSTTTITSFSITTDKAGRKFWVRFDTIRAITHNATSLFIPGGSIAATAAGDVMEVISLGSGNVKVLGYTKADGTALVAAAGVSAASQAEQETGTEAGKYVAPATQHFHPSAAKFWSYTKDAAQTLTASYNVTSRTDTGTGRLDITIATDFSSANWCAIASCDTDNTTGVELFCNVTSIAVGTVSVAFDEKAGAAGDPAAAYVVGFGDQ